MDHPEICGKHKFNYAGTRTKYSFDWQRQLWNSCYLRDLMIPTKRCDPSEQLWFNSQRLPTLASGPVTKCSIWASFWASLRNDIHITKIIHHHLPQWSNECACLSHARVIERVGMGCTISIAKTGIQWVHVYLSWYTGDTLWMYMYPANVSECDRFSAITV